MIKSTFDRITEGLGKVIAEGEKVMTDVIVRFTPVTQNPLDKETTQLIDLQIKILTEALSIDNFLNKNVEVEEKTIGVQEIKEWISHLENEEQKLKNLEMVLAVIGTMKAGKSTTINAIVGMEVLPNRETPMTTLPTLIRHKYGQTQPVLKINKNEPLVKLSKAVAKKLKSLNDNQKNRINLQGREDGRALIASLLEKDGYKFKKEYKGQEAIFEFLNHLNDIMRLARDSIIGIEPPYDEYENLNDLPVIEVEFFHLKEMKSMANGNLVILDTPGPNEFGQSESLRYVFKKQLEKASAILLTVDYTQMNAEADQKVREELDSIEDQLSKDRLYVVVNKFDQATKNSMSKDEIKNYIANILMKDKVDISQVFPVSSYYAFLANKAKVHLEKNKNLPDEPWVSDFGKRGLGAVWQNEINDINKVKACIKQLWTDSFFEEPVEKIIKEAYATAANKSLASAIEKLTAYNNEFLNMLKIRANAMMKDISEIEQMQQSLKTDISRCESVKKEVDKKVKTTLLELSQEMKGAMEAQWFQVTKTIDKFFREGKALEKEMQDQILQDEFKKRGLGRIASFFSKHQRNENKPSQLFDPKQSKNTCANPDEASKLIADISKVIIGIFKNADLELNSLTNTLIKSTIEKISQQINVEVADTLKKARAELQDNGIEINFNLPNIDLTVIDVDTSALFIRGQRVETETTLERIHGKNIWGRICKILQTEDLGTKVIPIQSTTHIVDIDEIKNQISEQLKKQASELSNQTENYLRKRFIPEIDKHLNKLVEYLERYHDVLNKVMRDKDLDQVAKMELEKQIENLLKGQEKMQADIILIKAAV